MPIFMCLFAKHVSEPSDSVFRIMYFNSGPCLRTDHESIRLHSVDGYHCNSSTETINKTVSESSRLIGQETESGGQKLHLSVDFLLSLLRIPSATTQFVVMGR